MDSTGGRIIWTIVVITCIGLAVLGIVLGPRLVRDGRAMVGPIFDLARSEESVASLNRELPFTPPADGRVSEERLAVFLALRRDLLVPYQRWAALRDDLEKTQPESLAGAKLALGAVRDVFADQDRLLRRHAMSPAELGWLESRVYDDWLAALEQGDDWGNPKLAERLAGWLEEDLAAVAEARRRHGGGAALDQVEAHLRRRQEELAGRRPPALESVPAANEELFLRHLDAIRELDLTDHAELHSRLTSAPGTFNVGIEAGAKLAD